MITGADFLNVESLEHRGKIIDKKCLKKILQKESFNLTYEPYSCIEQDIIND